MKQFLFFVVAIVLVTIPSLAQLQGASTSKVITEAKGEAIGPQAQWTTLVADLGDVIFMTKTDAEFLLTNTGDQPLIITAARASCGCTNLRYSKEPILPGETSTVQVSFNGSGMGNVKKTITITTNASASPTILAFTANVVKEEKTAETTTPASAKKQ
jgi:hypothetical protein